MTTGDKPESMPENMPMGSGSGSTLTERALAALADRISQVPGRFEGSIVIRLEGEEGGTWSIHSTGDHARVLAGAASGESRAEVVGDARTIRDVLEGKVEGKEALLLGGIRVRGDIDFLERLSAALGTHRPP